MSGHTPTMAHPALELLARYRAVLGAAWAARQELAGPERLADEATSLPAALAIQETPIHRAPRRAAWVIMALFAAVLTWSIVGQVDIVAVAQGRMRERVEIDRDLATQQARLKESQAALAESRQAKTAQREQLTQLRSPVTGTVQQLAVFSTGGVVTAAQTLMVIVPDGGAVTAQVVIDNRDIGLVGVGQKAEVKVETFSFTRYGTVPATVTGVTADAVQDEKRGAIFPATLRLDSGVMDVDGKLVKLAPGMLVTAEVKTGRRRVIDFLLSPVRQATGESFTTAGVVDPVLLGAGIVQADSRYVRNGNNLELSILGTTDKLVVQNWYLGSQYQVEQFRYADGTTVSNSQAAGLLSAMAAFSAPAAVETRPVMRSTQWRHADYLVAAV